MAKAGEEDDVEYESDPEEEKRLLGMRRREASSDDEEEEEEKPRIDRRAPVDSDESDGQGGAADYEDEELEREEDEVEVYEDEEDGVYEDYEEVVNGTDRFAGGKEGIKERGIDGPVAMEVKEVEEVKVEEGVEAKTLDNNLEDGEEAGEDEEDEEGKKEIEPFSVPTAGAFYMHDDRFRDNAAGRNRRTYGGRKLWESKDEKKWGHDKFEEMNLQERHYDQGRRASRGQYQGRGAKNQGPDRGYTNKRSKGKAFNNGDNVNQPPKAVRGRGPRKYENRWKRSGQAAPTQNKPPEKSFERTPHGSSGRVYIPAASNTESDKVPAARKNSSLSSASPPFYPSASSGKDITQKRDVQSGSTSRNLRAAPADESYLRGKSIADSVGMDKLSIDDLNAGKSSNNMQMPSSGSSVVNTMQTSQSRPQGRGVPVTSHMSYQSTQIQANKVPSTSQPSFQRNPVQNRVQSSFQPPSQQLGQRSGSGSQASSPPKTALSINSYEPGDVETSSESSKSTGALVGKGKGSIQGSGRGSFAYGGAQVMGAAGNMAVGRGDQNFPGTPTFLPVMQFGGQHPGGLGVPAVGMAFPGYVGNPQLGLGNSEMTWLPVLAGAAGALGATYCSPYIMDGAYHARPTGQTSSAGSSSKENNTNKSNNEPPQRPEPVNDEFGQRQKPRRYSEMDFKQPSTSA
ncbi:CASC3/Barentsz eIF4AIII binding [Euphorbia peplus]|nr:CASC3/Barentsz eIF4AIII binding [Euphorbia peplus]